MVLKRRGAVLVMTLCLLPTPGCGSTSAQPNLRRLALKLSDLPPATHLDSARTWTNAQAAARDGIGLERRSYDWLCEQGHVGLERVAKEVRSYRVDVLAAALGRRHELRKAAAPHLAPLRLAAELGQVHPAPIHPTDRTA